MTEFGLYVRWDGDSRVEVRVTAEFKNQTCGLCGNYNGDGSKEDEFRTPDGVFVSWHTFHYKIISFVYFYLVVVKYNPNFQAGN